MNFLEIFLLIQRQKDHISDREGHIFCGKFAINCGKGGLTSETVSSSLKSSHKGDNNYPICEDLGSFLS